MTIDLESRTRRLEDRAQISEQVIRYALGVDRRDWEMFAGCFTDPVRADFSASGKPAADYARDELVDMVRGALSGFTATQHLSPNHVIEFDGHDPDRAVCHSYMTPDGWRIESLTQHVSWPEGNPNAVSEATARLRSGR
jgi:hypothetical protein